jgi:hypothetical protein
VKIANRRSTAGMHAGEVRAFSSEVDTRFA